MCLFIVEIVLINLCVIWLEWCVSGISITRTIKTYFLFFSSPKMAICAKRLYELNIGKTTNRLNLKS